MLPRHQERPVQRPFLAQQEGPLALSMYHGCTKPTEEPGRTLPRLAGWVSVGRRGCTWRRPSPERRAAGVMLDVDGLAARLGVTARFVRRLVEERRVPYPKIGRLVRFDPVEVERWIDTARVEPARPWLRRVR